MKLKKAIEILEAHNKWRLGGDGDMTEPPLLTTAIDVIVKDYRETERQDFVGNYLDKKMANHNLPMGMEYYSLLGKHTGDAEKKWKIKLKNKKK
ncbi:MAG: hypothetical protein AABY22_10935 [Nanoarchaeota archaeon]